MQEQLPRLGWGLFDPPPVKGELEGVLFLEVGANVTNPTLPLTGEGVTASMSCG